MRKIKGRELWNIGPDEVVVLVRSSYFSAIASEIDSVAASKVFVSVMGKSIDLLVRLLQLELYAGKMQPVLSVFDADDEYLWVVYSRS